MKTLAYVPLHYGKDYLKYVLASVRDSVEDILILYTSKPSYGQAGHLPNPDSEEELRAICEPFSVIWEDVTGKGRESDHRQLVYRHTANSDKDYDLVLAVDSDEVWNPDKVESALEVAFDSGKRFNHISGNNWFHFWKGFKEYNQDGFYPMRITNLKYVTPENIIIDTGEIYHMGYAISEEAMAYKLSCHGHKSEIPSNWLKDKWIDYEKGVTMQLHPASRDIWIETMEYKGKLPELLHSHPYYEALFSYPCSHRRDNSCSCEGGNCLEENPPLGFE